MENHLPRASDVQRNLSRSVQEKIVMISSHPGWLDDHENAETEIAADPVDLVRIFHEVLERMRHAVVLQMDDEPVTVGQMVDQIWRRLAAEEMPLRLSQILRMARTERAVICLELALLELVRLQAVLLRQDRGFSDILLKRNATLPSS